MAPSPFRWSTIILCLVLYFRSAVGSSACYYPDGSVASHDVPCNTNDEFSTCCGPSINPAGACLANNLCRDADLKLIRGSCTDQSWESPSCPLYCLTAQRGGHDVVSCGNVTHDDVSYCCEGHENCCDSGDGRFIVSPAPSVVFATWNKAASTYIQVLSTPTISTSSITQTTSTSSITTSSETQTTPAPTTAPPIAPILTSSMSSFSPSPDLDSSNDRPQLNSGAIAGIAIGSAAGAFLISALIYLLCLRARRAAAAPHQQSPINTREMDNRGTMSRFLLGSTLPMTFANKFSPQEHISEPYGNQTETIASRQNVRYELGATTN
ncbi:hypothetical protein F4777DRAFT_385349 [Nemania sp. FL0916]|nr:hypothetical protein F4777DRAFT_385349 [Nemania sp. FL0916]